VFQVSGFRFQVPTPKFDVGRWMFDVGCFPHIPGRACSQLASDRSPLRAVLRDSLFNGHCAMLNTIEGNDLPHPALLPKEKETRSTASCRGTRLGARTAGLQATKSMAANSLSWGRGSKVRASVDSLLGSASRGAGSLFNDHCPMLNEHCHPPRRAHGRLPSNEEHGRHFLSWGRGSKVRASVDSLLGAASRRGSMSNGHCPMPNKHCHPPRHSHSRLPSNEGHGRHSLSPGERARVRASVDSLVGGLLLAGPVQCAMNIAQCPMNLVTHPADSSRPSPASA
jgi:hypothetical protein